MRAGLKRGFTPSQITLKGRDIGVAEVVEAKSPEESPFYAPFREWPASISPELRAALAVEGAAAIREAVMPAHAKLLAFLRDEYIPGARKSLAAYALPDGRAYYQTKIAVFTTRTLTPDTAPAIGLPEVTKILSQTQASL